MHLDVVVASPELIQDSLRSPLSSIAKILGQLRQY